MKRISLYKSVLFVLALLLFGAAAFSFGTAKNVRAEALTDVFGGSNSGVVLDGNYATVKPANKDSLTLKNPLAANELAFETKMSTSVKKVSLTFTTDSYDVNGNVSGEDVIKTVTHELAITADGATPIRFDETNGDSAATVASGTDLKILFTVENNFVSVKVNDHVAIKSNDAKYKVKCVDKCEANTFTFIFETDEESETEAFFSLVSVDQGAVNYTANGEYKQTFATVDNAEGGEIAKLAKPRAGLGDAAFVRTSDGYKPIVVTGTEYKFDFTAYSVLGTVKSGDLYLAKVSESDKVSLSNEDKPKSVIFVSGADNRINVKSGDEVIEKFSFNVIDRTTADTSAPVYDATEGAISSYKTALAKAATAEYDGKTYSVRLGEKVTVPSLETLVSDDLTSYAGMTHTLYYKTPETSSSTSGFDIPTDKAGKYEFYVIFKDAAGNEMDKNKFFTVDDDDENKIDTEESTHPYAKYIFTFDIVDDAPIKITSVTQSKGYVNTSYTVSSFTVSAKGYTTVYELYYNSDSSATPTGDDWESAWVKIPVASEVEEGDEMPAGFTYEEVKNIGYSGSLTFTPVKTGKYVIKCTVTSTNSIRTASSTASVSVENKPRTVKPDSHWLENNVWSVVFLSIGTLCLIAIIVLLCIKPKDETTED